MALPFVFTRILNRKIWKSIRIQLFCLTWFLSIFTNLAGENTDSLKRILTQGNLHEKEEAHILFLLAESEVNMGNHASAIAYYERSVACEKRAGETGSENYASRLGDIGYCYYMMEQPLKALPYLRESLQLSVKGGFDKQAASMYSNIGSIYTEWGDYNKGLINNQMALVIDKRSGDFAQVSTDLNNIGKIYEHWGKYDLAVKYYFDALEIAKKTGNQSMVAVRFNNLGIVFKAWKKYEEALVYFNDALAIDRTVGNLDKVGKRLAYIGATYLAMEQYEQCFSYLNQALPIIQKSELLDELARLYNLFGKYYLATSSFPKAVDYFRKSQEYAVRKNLKPLQMANLQGLSEALDKSGNSRLALETLRQFLVVKDSVFTAESDTRLAEFQARFENEKMKLENEMLRKDDQLKHNVYLFSGILGLSLILILLAIIFILRLRARNILQAKELAEGNAARFQSDLETKNRELALQAMMIIKSNESIASIIEGLDQNIKNGVQTQDMDLVLSQIRHLEKDKSWKEFETHFSQVHSDFYQKLHEKFPDITLNERKLCAFLRLNMTTKDIASITHQSVHSINVARTRLRRKMNLANSEENLVSFLMSL
jgi:tetratricopeptide (TPR) repeat protein/DNA-binding CsgD family transcriptional regulator